MKLTATVPKDAPLYVRTLPRIRRKPGMVYMDGDVECAAGGGLRMTRYMCDGKTRAHYSHFRTIQELLGHKDVSTTMIYTHVLNRGGRGVDSPADRL